MGLSTKFSLFGFLCIVLVLNAIDSARILGLFPTHSRSHLIIHSAIAEALAERGHNVTIVATHPPLKKTYPYTYIHLDVPPVSVEFFTEAIRRPAYLKIISNYVELMTKLSNTSLHHPLMQKLMDEESFDLVVLGYLVNDFLFGVAAHFKCPLILSITIPPTPNVNDLVGNPQEFAYVPPIFTSEKQPIKFFDRVKNFIVVTIGTQFMYMPYYWWTQEHFYTTNFPSNRYPSFGSMMKNVSLVFVAHHFSQTPIRPNVPAIVEIGGIQIKDKPHPLPGDILEILDSSRSLQNGVIYFSLGTSIHKSNLNESKVAILFKVLSKLPQTILCKWSDQELPIESPNIFYKRWLPQDDVLHHRNVKLFISHGGLGGIVEAQYHGVPMVGIPLFGDQFSNVEKVQTIGHGLVLDFLTLTERNARNVIVEVLSNRSYTDNVGRFSKLYRDRPLSAKESVVFWAEYVLRHHGAPHLQSPAVHLNYFQLLSLDVIAFLVCIFFVFLKTISILFALMKAMFCRNKVKQE